MTVVAITAIVTVHHINGGVMKLILEIQNDIVIRARNIEDSEVSNATGISPYYKGKNMTFDSAGNRYANALRNRDNRIQSGDTAEVVVLPEGNPDEYVLKKKVSGGYTNDSESDDTRMYRSKIKKAMYPIEKYYSLVGMIPEVSAVDDVFGAGSFSRLASIFENGEDIPEIGRWEIFINKFDQKNKVKFIFSIASHLANLKKEETRKDAIRWFEKLIFEGEEERAYTWLAGIYAYAGDFDLAVEMYEQMIKIKGISKEDKAEAKEKMEYLGRGKGVYEEALSLFNSENYEAGISACERFDKIATGRAKIMYREKVKRIKGKCIGRLGRAKGNLKDITAAVDMLSKPIEDTAKRI